MLHCAWATQTSTLCLAWLTVYAIECANQITNTSKTKCKYKPVDNTFGALKTGVNHSINIRTTRPLLGGVERNRIAPVFNTQSLLIGPIVNTQSLLIGWLPCLKGSGGAKASTCNPLGAGLTLPPGVGRGNCCCTCCPGTLPTSRLRQVQVTLAMLRQPGCHPHTIAATHASHMTSDNNA